MGRLPGFEQTAVNARCKRRRLLIIVSLGDGMEDDSTEGDHKMRRAVEQLIELERQYYFEKRNVKTERQRKVRELIERQAADDDA